MIDIKMAAKRSLDLRVCSHPNKFSPNCIIKTSIKKRKQKTEENRYKKGCVVSSLFEVEKALGIASLNLKVRTSRNQKQESFISARACIFKRSYKNGTD